MTKEQRKIIKVQGDCREIIKNKSHELLCEGPCRTGKTFAILAKLHYLASTHPGLRILFVKKTKESMAESVLQTFEDEVLGFGHYLTQSGGKRNNRQSYEYNNSSQIVIVGLDKPSKILSSEYDFIYCNEATEITEESYKYLLTRLTGHHCDFTQIISCCNPQAPHHWLNQRFNDERIPNKTRIRVGFESNPRWFNEEVKEWTDSGKITILRDLKSSLTGIEYTRMFDGIWAASDRLVIDAFNEKKHVISNCVRRDVHPERLLENMERFYAGFDFGYTAPSAFIVVGFNKANEAFVFVDEMACGKQLNEWVNIIKPYMAKYNVLQIYCDAAEPRSIEHFRLEGLPAVGAKKGEGSILAGCKIINNRFHQNKLYIFEDSSEHQCPILMNAKKPTTLVQELLGYEMDVNTDKPVAKNDHAISALRYVLSSVDETAEVAWVISGGDDEDIDEFEGNEWKAI